ncbi:UDP-N-acetylglucosamine--N-acetylmuramyl-(pentapeptide) pyrophosphoryl-undecaprenol N-acetylglucosamine transferase [Nocardia terpenica]|uniref:UDP-N-acetylglucosamine--N-acetylmuramyl-(pentapeptide) pyrophosphoryl-undecaprenol N-acetylglucosamine transferase n=1 Tax=Nocardia terpenica TaxID=455432 RepID=A0A6G9Z4U0_9NOCA|nr:UDP-N-acetylglucosamine--N-acetylmuramyl-(pentapeptide) pyrophosphoryl-undecaprenol N-acetylglucosamine transferase [Nocardia terpenica]QIS20411.1 UDP-N-acetylglucosamine--N-acetylmuramyl-(pentapeptide) pyrophosphoryl-undecaprenol N-acetylglucosamine transferase [Nocardia terpenica]
MSDAASAGRTVRLIVAGGGTGGHTFPALTTIRCLRHDLAASDHRLVVTWIGTANSLEARVSESEGIGFVSVATGKIRRDRNPLKVISWVNVADMLRVPFGIAQASWTVARVRPHVVLTTGGFASVPVGVAAWLCRRPLIIHEQTVRLGLANRLLARLANRIAVSSDTTLELLPGRVRASAVVTGNPIRPEIFDGHADKAIGALGLDGFDRSLPTVYVTGGAQGSVQINTVVREILPWLLGRVNVIHQCGRASTTDATHYAAALDPRVANRYTVTEFIGSELPDVLALADVVISRSGAGTVAELTALGRAAVLIPLASAAGNEQAHNARVLDDAGAAVALTGDVSASALREALEPLLADPDHRASVAERARQHGRPDAADELARVVLSAAR